MEFPFPRENRPLFIHYWPDILNDITPIIEEVLTATLNKEKIKIKFESSSQPDYPRLSPLRLFTSSSYLKTPSLARGLNMGAESAGPDGYRIRSSLFLK